MMGYPEQELTTMSVKDITHPLDFTAHNEPMQQLMNNSIESFSLEKRYLRKDRSVLWGNISVSLIKNEKKEPAFLATIVEDITQRKSFEAAIQNLAVLSSDQNELNTFDVIAKNFAEALHADCTIIGILSEDGKNIQTIAVNYDGKKTANFSFAVGATPCELVMKDGYTYIRDNFPEIFPGRISHVHEGMKSYIGTVLTNEEGRSEGLLIAMARKPLDVVEQYRTIHSLFAERTVNELVRLEADTSLQKSEEEYRFLVEQSQDIVVRLDVKGIIRYCSPAISHVGGYDAAAVVGRSFKEFFVDPEEIKEGFQQMKKSVLNGTSSRYEFRFRTRSGGSLWVESVGRGVTYQDGTIELQTILRDISERKHTESALKESERRYRGIIESSMDGFWLYDASANILQVNDAYCTMSGYTRDELCSMTISDIEAIEDPEETEIHIRSVKERGRDKFESIHRAKNGTLFDVEINTVLLKESNVLVAFISDITERKTAELKLRESERRFRGILEDVSLLSVILNDQGMIEMVNDYLLTATGYVRNEIIGRSWFDQFVPEEFREELRSVYLRGLKNGDTPGPFEMNVVTKTGDLLFVRWTNITMYDSEKRIIGITSLGEDITEQRKVQNELQDREEQFRTLITSMQQGIALHEMIFNEDGTPADYRFIDVNPSFERITGLQRADLVGRTVMEVMPGTEQYWLEKYARVVTSGEPMLYENYAAELGKFFEVIAYRPKEKQFATIVTDVTERKLNEQKIQASERQYRLLAENATDVIWTMNLDGQFTYISPSVLQLRGFTPEEVMKQPMKEVICEGSIQPVVEGLKRFRSIQYTREGSTSNLTEIEQPCKNGTTVWTEVVTHGIFDEQGNIIEILGVSRDITARKRSEDLLKARLSLSEFATTHSVKELLRQILDVAEKITESSIGFFHFVEDDQKTISLQTWSTNTLLHMCRAEGDGRHYDIGMAGVWVDCLYARRPVVHNEFEQLTHRKGLPVGHAPIHRELLIPILRNEKVVGILGVGNKPYQYDQNDIEIANQLATMSWDILERRKAELDLLDHERALAGLSQAAVELLQMTERNTRTVMASALQKLGEGLDADRAYVFVNHSMGDDEPLFNLLYEWVREGITPAIDEPEMQELNIRLKFPSIWHALSTGKPYNRLIDLVPPEEQSLLTGQSIKSLLVVPISIDDELWGFLGVDAVRSARRWNADNESVLNVAAESIGIAEQRIHAVVKLSEREQLLKFALDASGDGLWTYTIPTNEVYFSDEVKQLAGYAGTFTEDNFQFWLDHIHPEDRQGAMDAMERHLRGEAPIFTHEHRFLCNNGEYRWMLDRGKVLKWDKDGMPYQIFGTYSDIHQRKAIEQQVRDLNEKLEQKVSERTQQLSESIQEMESFSYSISHDLRAPVRAIDSFTKILAEEEEKQLSAEGKRLLKTVRSNTARMGHMIDDLLQFSRASRAEIKKTVFDMHAVVVKVLEESVVSEHHRVFRTVVHPLPKAYGDPSLLRQVAVNLIGNAVKFTRNRSEAHIEIGGSEENGMTTYWVKDNGTGFNMQYADKLFGVFHRLHNQQEFEGTGVGLAIVHRILKKHTGVISVESTEGVGTTFTFTLPAEPGI
jgi:PAS domain S-box-containing protein